MNNKHEINDLFGIAEPVTKLIEIVSSAIGTVYEPRKIKKLADAEAYRIEKISSAINDSGFSGELEYLDGKLNVNNNVELSLLIDNEIKRISKENENIKCIADYAYNELEDDTNKINIEIDEDWKNNFFDKGRKIYSGDLQIIFGKILAGEIKQPGTYSKRLLGILSNLSQREAEIFNKLSRYTMKNHNRVFIVADSDILKKFDIKIEEIILLEEAGLINSNLMILSGSKTYEYKNYFIDFIDNEPSLRVYFLTNSGSELVSIIVNEISLEYLVEIKKKYNIKKLNYSLIESVRRVDDKMLYSYKDTKSI